MAETTAHTCVECGAAAKVFIAVVKAGQVTCAAFCEEHAQAAGVLDTAGYGLLQPLDAGTETPRLEGSVRCPNCDCSQRDFERRGKFGCAHCYGVFTGVLTPMLGRMHRGAVHRGKIPLRGSDPATVRHRIDQLQEELNDAVRMERFEGAAQTRDTIALLKAKLLAVAGAGKVLVPAVEAPGAAARGLKPGTVPAAPKSDSAA